ncbi:MAG: ATPase, T2SS/T4P/T4SS family [Candidatus Omnitrophica bacterium]|nr:ATPase, T2SS/T4P/T4SS family [Candidatus Omnitrophota bacterium]MDD5236229.1 ATPase, T2SS/T4P/T4SS family [Candidatus Omnitrophota bacterium]MDD5611111.1 ATPase, T2SS/T4P/T4SS family [Candidatus Omnitrophota bacterium]
MPQEKYLKLGELLIRANVVTPEQLDKAIAVQKQEGGRIGEILIKLGMIKEEDMVATLGKQLNIPYFSLGSGLLKPALDQELEKLIPRDFASRNVVLPLSRNLKSLTCAMFDPLDLILLDNLRKVTNCEVNPVLATRSDIIRGIEDFYGRFTFLEEAMGGGFDSEISLAEISTEGASGREDELTLDKLIARAEEAPVVKLVDLIIRQAISERASDIHIEPFKDKINLRYRIDGKLYEIPPPAKHLQLPIISRIKILAKLDIAEKRLPQDGAFTVKTEGRIIDLRISTLPTIYGEKVVLRLLDRSKTLLDLNQLGFDQHQLEIFRNALKVPWGLVFLTGPTGSGKTTTLYAALNEIKSPTKNIVTIEDPVEYRLDGVNQVQVKNEIGLTFAAALRSFLRQDPDIMLVGEVRDLETAEICMRSALTGHLVLSTLHTNDAPSAINRLLDIGVEPYLLTPSLILVVAQRLARKLCPNCKEPYEPTAEQLGGIKLKTDLIYKAQGCAECNNIGYKGRICVGEFLPVSEEIRELISQKASYLRIREVARKSGMVSLFESGIKKVEEGITSLEEILSVSAGGE